MNESQASTEIALKTWLSNAINKATTDGYKQQLSPVNEISPDTDISRLEQEAVTGKIVRVKPAAFLAGFTKAQRAVFSHKHAVYGLPTTELIDWLTAEIGGRVAIEVGAGNGGLGRALGIPTTDSHLQLEPEIKLYYMMMGQPTIHYPDDVEKLDYKAAILKYKPEVVVGSWITHKYREDQHDLGGNMHGFEEEWILKHCKKYIMIGHDKTHWGKPILKAPHQTHRPEFLYSRSMSAGDFVKVWG